jgi:predicted SAM-dependent methyltransferase
VYWCDAFVKLKSLPMRRLAFGDRAVNTHRIVDIGCGPVHQQFEEGVPVRVDLDERWKPDYRADARHLPFADASFDIVFSSHCLEHFSRADQDVCLNEWKRVLVPGGEFRLVLPNIAWAAEKIAKGVLLTETEQRDVRNVLYGGQSSPHDFHYNGFTPELLTNVMAEHGFKLMTMRTEGYNIIANFRDLRAQSTDGAMTLTADAQIALQSVAAPGILDNIAAGVEIAGKAAGVAGKIAKIIRGRKGNNKVEKVPKKQK